MKSLPRTLILTIPAIALTASVLAAPVAQGGQKFSMTLSAANEVPGPGDSNASGTADVIINPGQGRICWEITTSGINSGYSVVAGTGGHIHSGAAGATGGIVVSLGVTLNGTNSGCTDVSRELIEQIRKNPQNYYVNLHWADTTEPITLPSFAAGGLRAQLAKAPLHSN